MTKKIKKSKMLKCELIDKKGKYHIRCRLENPKKFDKKSFRTVKQEFTRLIVACEKEHFKKGRCDQAMRVQSLILHLPTKLPSKTKG